MWRMRPLGQGREFTAVRQRSAEAGDRAGMIAVELDHTSMPSRNGQAIPAGQLGEDEAPSPGLPIELRALCIDGLPGRGLTAKGADAEHGSELWQQALAAARFGDGTVINAVFEPPVGLASSIDALSGGSGLTAQQRLGDASPTTARTGSLPQPSPGVEEHGKLWWWLHDHGLALTKHERADVLRKGWGAESGVLVTDKNGTPVNVGQLSDDEVIALDKELRGQPIGPALAAAAAPTMTSWGWNDQEPYNVAKRQLSRLLQVCAQTKT
jgi:hypothetical protein